MSYLDKMESEALKMSDGGSTEKIYVADADFYVRAKNDEEAIEEANKIARDIDLKNDNKASINHLYERPRGIGEPRKVFKDGGETEEWNVIYRKTKDSPIEYLTSKPVAPKEARSIMNDFKNSGNKYHELAAQLSMGFKNGGEVDSNTIKLVEILNKHNPAKLQWDRGTIWVNAGNGLQKGSITDKFKGYGDSTSVGNIVWKGVRSENAKENIEILTNGQYTIKKDFNNEPYAAKVNYY